jgi:hypothetical protein
MADAIGYMRQCEIETGDVIDYVDVMSKALDCVTQENQIEFRTQEWLDEILYGSHDPLTTETSHLLSTCTHLVGVIYTRLKGMGLYHDGSLPYKCGKMFRTSMALLRTDVFHTAIQEELNELTSQTSPSRLDPMPGFGD